jgi:hypothetical protein
MAKQKKPGTVVMGDADKRMFAEMDTWCGCEAQA